MQINPQPARIKWLHYRALETESPLTLSSAPSRITMHRLVVNPGTPQAWEIVLKPGFNSIGRGQENDFTISHDSVSTLHCQIVVDGDTIRIEDLGSTNGTFINDQRTLAARLLPGQRLRLGEIGMQLESDVTPVSAQAEPANVAVSLSRDSAPEPAQAQWAKGSSVTPSTVEEEKAIYCKNFQRLRTFGPSPHSPHPPWG